MWANVNIEPFVHKVRTLYNSLIAFRVIIESEHRQSIAIVAEAANAKAIAFGVNGDPTLTRSALENGN